ncbi:sodium:solute symporter [Burkholderia cenocepacia]|uniref:sodium:solute symporter n=1 Tax=Burkholderia cenocepacia TaxID=95486 RepID=UPI002855D793|nr:sodium:solute symporter [Burkholderia cenocepacia]MDR5644409.1 sodium:solute symporter [Burkholderia cenocepacia]
MLGSGEMAVHSGMAGSLYPIVTAFGMFALALIARKLWHAGEPIWEILGNRYGPVVRRAVALLSLVWMAGVLAAQIHGIVAVLSIVGFATYQSVLVSVIAILVISAVDIGVAAMVFAVCLLASNLVLFNVLAASGGLPVYFHAWPSFIQEVRTAPAIETVATVVAIGFLVITGSDYQQFVIAARRPADAWLGCVLAALFLTAVGFLPAATVVAALHSGKLSGLTDYAGVIPRIILHSSPHAGLGFLCAIVLAACGSGTAVTRAMSTALMDLHPMMRRHPFASRILIIAPCSATAIDGQSIVSTIVSMNMVYISAVGLLFVIHQADCSVTPRCASRMMICGAVTSMLTALLFWARAADMPDWSPLAAGMIASAVPFLGSFFSSNRRRIQS